MYSFKNDYSEGAHPRILKALLETNLEQSEGYGEDSYSLQAAELIKQKLGREDVAIHLLTGGTQANLTALSAFLRPHEAAIAPATGHILVHETGAIEATGHKVISVESNDGKLTPEGIKTAVAKHTDEHMVKPKLVYISNPTEIGSIYGKAELTAIYECCRENKLYLYLDGARLGSALTSEENDLTMAELAGLVDAFYIGGTKCGALLGEALVICRDELKEDFRFHMKQKGAMLAKGRVIGLQFLELFKDELYFELARHANRMAGLLTQAISGAGCSFFTPFQSNQIFPIFPDTVIAELEKNYSFYVWEKTDEFHSAVRLVTSWATKEEAVLSFIADLNKALSSESA